MQSRTCLAPQLRIEKLAALLCHLMRRTRAAQARRLTLTKSL